MSELDLNSYFKRNNLGGHSKGGSNEATLSLSGENNNIPLQQNETITSTNIATTGKPKPQNPFEVLQNQVNDKKVNNEMNPEEIILEDEVLIPLDSLVIPSSEDNNDDLVISLEDEDLELNIEEGNESTDLTIGVKDNEEEPTITIGSFDDSHEILLETKISDFHDELKYNIISLTAKPSRISDFKYDNIIKKVEDYVISSTNFPIDIINSNFGIKPLITHTSKHEDLQKLFAVLNIRKNIELVDSKYQNMIREVDSKHSEKFSEITKERDELILLITSFKNKVISDIESVFNNEMNELNSFELSIMKALKKFKQDAIEKEVDKHGELFRETEYLTELVDETRNKIVQILGKNHLKKNSSTNDEIELPKNQDELEDLLIRIKNEVEDLEIDDKSYVKKIVGKLMSILFFPTKYTSNDLKSLVMVLNTLAFVILALKFRDILVVLFTGSILLDIFAQFKTAKRAKDTEYLLEFANKSDEIIESITSTIIDETTHVIDIQNNKVEMALTEKVEKLKETLEKTYDAKVTEIMDLFEESDLIERVDNKYDKIEDLISAKADSATEAIKANKSVEKEQLAKELAKVTKIANEIPNYDIYESGNEDNITLTTKLKVGRYCLSGEHNLGFDFHREFPEGSYLVKAKDSKEKVELLDKVKLMLIQQLAHIRPERLKLNLIDITESGHDLIEMVSENEEISILISSDDKLQEKLKETVKEIEKRYKTATKEYSSVTEYNKVVVERNIEPMKYEIFVFYNYNPELIKNINFRTLITEGGKSGFSSVVLFNERDLYDSRGDKDKALEEKLNSFDFTVFEHTAGGSSSLVLQNNHTNSGVKIMPSIEHLDSIPLEYSRSDMLNKVRDIEEIAEEGKKAMILYSDLEKGYAPKLFQKDTLKGIEICTGFRDGNLNKPESVQLGDELVHALMAGKTGAGKSNTINVILMNLIRSYSPEWLELFMIDFKNVEFNFYTNLVETEAYTKKICNIPHTSMIAGTTDAEYALSVFEKALKEMERRKKILSKGIRNPETGEVESFKKIEDYNRFVLKYKLKGETNDLTGEVIKILPRILIMLDEFQVMFQIDDIDVITKIKGYITRLSKEARSMGIHMFFTSQSMDGTLSDDVKSQFAMRWCLSAASGTSKEVLGNDAASKLRGKGFIYMSGTMERKVEDNQLYKVPFIPPDYINQVIDDVRTEVERMRETDNLIPFHKQEFYAEDAVHGEKELKLYCANAQIKAQRNAVLLGPKVVFKDKSVPENFMLGKDDNENVLITGNDKIATVNLINTLLANFSSKERTRILVANFDRTLDGLIKEEYIADNLKPFLKSSNTEDVMEAALDLLGIEKPEDASPYDTSWLTKPIDIDYDETKHNRWYIFLIGLNKAEGFNEDFVEDQYVLPLVTLLKNGPAFGVNTVINYKLPFKVSKILPLCAHRITAKVDESLSFDLFNNRKAMNLLIDNNVGLSFGMYRSTIDDKSFKFKIYNFGYDSSLLAPKELSDVAI